MKKFTKTIATVMAAATMMFSTTSYVSAEKAENRTGFYVGQPNYEKGHTITFTYFGEQPESWKASTAGKLKIVVKEMDYTVYNFNYKGEKEFIRLKAYDKDGNLMDEITINLI